MANAEETPPGNSVTDVPPIATPKPHPPQPPTPSPSTGRRAGWLGRWLKRPSTITLLGTGFVAAGLAASAVPYWRHPRLANYDLQAYILAITAVSLFFTAQFAREAADYQRLRDAQDRHERRRALSEAMINAVDALISRERMWRTTVMQPFVTTIVDYSLLETALPSASLFQLETVGTFGRALAALSALHEVATNAREVMRVPGADYPQLKDARALFSTTLEGRIVIAIRTLKELRGRLVHERDGRDD